jgi:hypothetical protein
MHDGSVARLCDAARPHALLAGADTSGPALTGAERDDIAAFLRTLGPRTGPAADEAAASPCAAS